MKKSPSKSSAKPAPKRAVASRRPATQVETAGKFDEVLALIDAARGRAYRAINTELIGLYWTLGAYISKKIASAEWGDGVVDELAATIARQYPAMRGYTRRNLFRMRQFFEAYGEKKRVSPLVTQLPWTHHLIILSQTRDDAEREFYMLAAIGGRWTKRELERQIRTKAIAREDARLKKVSPAVTQLHPGAVDEFKNAYSLEFLGLDGDHSEADLHGALLRNLGRKPHERPSIGVLLCATKDDEVVEYALARTSSPTLVAEYQTMLPPKAMLRRKLHELYFELASELPGNEDDA